MRYRRIVAAFVAVVVVLAAQWSWLTLRDEPLASRTDQGQLDLSGGGFSLIDQSGRPHDQDSLTGKHQIVVFGYTHCPDVCPTTLSRVAYTLDLLGEEAREVQAVFVTLDPERDRPDVLRDYVEAIDPRFVALTGTPEQVKQIAESYRVYFAKVGDDEDYLMDHSAYIYLVEPEGATAAYFRHDQDPEELADIIRRAIERRT